MISTVTATINSSTSDKEQIFTQNNEVLCRPDFFQACWCPSNSTTPISCTYLVRHAVSVSNSSHFCVYHIIRKTIECVNASYLFPQVAVSNLYHYLTLVLLIIGLIGNGVSAIILLSTKLRRFSVYRNLTILCLLNILYLAFVFIRYENIDQLDMRAVSVELCRLHTFLVAFTGHLCSWQLVSTSVQRLPVLFSLASHQATSWLNTSIIFILCVMLPLLIFDGQLLFNYGLLKNDHVCNEPSNYDIRQFRHAIKYPIDVADYALPNYHQNWMVHSAPTHSKGQICIVWNAVDTIVYGMLPFGIILICSFVIITKVLQRRRSTVTSGGMYHRGSVSRCSQDYLSTILITVNLLFLLMTSPLNILLMLQSIFECVFPQSISIKYLHVVEEYFRLLQNAYHALSFIFYCVVGKKFRSTGKSIGRTVYYKLLEFSIPHRCANVPSFPCCFDRRRSSSSGHTTSSNIRLGDGKRMARGQRRSSPVPMHEMRRGSYVTFNMTVKSARLATSVL